MKDKIKPKYNAAQNVGWMVKIAWKVRKRVLFICVAMAALEVLYNLTQLYVAPEILSCVERHAPVGELLGDHAQPQTNGRDAECVSGIRLHFPGAVRSRR